MSIASPASDTELSGRDFFHESFFAQINSNNLSFLRLFFFFWIGAMYGVVVGSNINGIKKAIQLWKGIVAF